MKSAWPLLLLVVAGCRPGPVGNLLCAYCTEDRHCGGNPCFQDISGQRFCGAPCDGCPAGFSCQPVAGTGGNVVETCFPKNASCLNTPSINQPGTGGNGSGGAPDMAGPASGADGGASHGTGFKFAVFGDARPPDVNASGQYPSDILGGIFALAQKLGAQFAVGTGDYMFADNAQDVAAQVTSFNQARAAFSGPVYLTMGNHECNGYTDSNCPNLNETANVRAFMALLPAGVQAPYYRIDVTTPRGAAKLVFVAANAWTTMQQSWLQKQLADVTPYTFVVRHEPDYDTDAPGVTPSESLIVAASYTLELNGHTHRYKRLDAKHVISGNAGAPLAPSESRYGMLMVEQQDNGDMTVTAYDEATGLAVDTWSVPAR